MLVPICILPLGMPHSFNHLHNFLKVRPLVDVTNVPLIIIVVLNWLLSIKYCRLASIVCNQSTLGSLLL